VPVDDTIANIGNFAQKVMALRELSSSVVFMIGHEFTLDMNGIVPGDVLQDRLKYMHDHSDWQQKVNLKQKIEDVFTKIIPIVKKNYSYPVAYAAAAFEWNLVPWSNSIFESVGMDAYVLDANGWTEEWIMGQVSNMKKFGKPVYSTEWGCPTSKGASNIPTELLFTFQNPYDEEQANYIARYCNMLNQNEGEFDGAFYTEYNDEYDGPKGYSLCNGMQRKKGFYMYKGYQIVT
jgi:hypothetical protein